MDTSVADLQALMARLRVASGVAAGGAGGVGAAAPAGQVVPIGRGSALAPTGSVAGSATGPSATGLATGSAAGAVGSSSATGAATGASAVSAGPPSTRMEQLIQAMESLTLGPLRPQQRETLINGALLEDAAFLGGHEPTFMQVIWADLGAAPTVTGFYTNGITVVALVRLPK